MGDYDCVSEYIIVREICVKNFHAKFFRCVKFSYFVDHNKFCYLLLNNFVLNS